MTEAGQIRWISRNQGIGLPKKMIESFRNHSGKKGRSIATPARMHA
jgi:hypothetical protein